MPFKARNTDFTVLTTASLFLSLCLLNTFVSYNNKIGEHWLPRMTKI